MEQTDLILSVLIVLSVLIGLNRGFCSEILSLTVYGFACFLGYVLIPVFRPVFASVPHETIQKTAAIFLGTLVSWLVLKLLTSSLISSVKGSSFRNLDRSLGGVFGLLRAGVGLILVYIVFSFGAPHLIESSRILTLFGGWMKNIPELDFQMGDNETLDASNWKKRALYYLQNKTIRTENGDRKLISAVSSVAAKRFSDLVFAQNGFPEELLSLTKEQKEELITELFEMNLTAWLNEKPVDKDELEEKMKEKITGLMKEKVIPDENSGD